MVTLGFASVWQYDTVVFFIKHLHLTAKQSRLDMVLGRTSGFQ